MFKCSPSWLIEVRYYSRESFWNFLHPGKNIVVSSNIKERYELSWYSTQCQDTEYLHTYIDYKACVAHKNLRYLEKEHSEKKQRSPHDKFSCILPWLREYYEIRSPTPCYYWGDAMRIVEIFLPIIFFLCWNDWLPELYGYSKILKPHLVDKCGLSIFPLY